MNVRLKGEVAIQTHTAETVVLNRNQREGESSENAVHSGILQVYPSKHILKNFSTGKSQTRTSPEHLQTFSISLS